MSKNYDNWERLVASVLDREHLKEIALCDSRSSSCNSSTTSSSLSIHSPLLSLDNSTGVNCDFKCDSFWNSRGKQFFLTPEAQEFGISCGDSVKEHLEYNYEMSFSYDNSGICEVAKLKFDLGFDICGKMMTRMLTPRTIYGAYIVYKLEGEIGAFVSAKGMIRFVDKESNDEAANRAQVVKLQPMDNGMVRQRENGWMEVGIGNFYVDEGDDGKVVEAHLMKTAAQRDWRACLLVQGIGFQPLVNVKQV